MRNFKDLEIWSKSHELTLEVYKMTSQFPNEENYGLVSQMRRSSQSIPTNIAEGCGRNSEKELLRFCNIAMGSASELEYQIILATDLKYLGEEKSMQLKDKLIIIRKQLNNFIQYLQNEAQKPNSLIS